MSAARKVQGIVTVGVSVATIALTVKLLLGPNGLRIAKMKSAKGAEQFCMSQASMWAHLADVSNKVYDSARMVTL